MAIVLAITIAYSCLFHIFLKSSFSFILQIKLDLLGINQSYASIFSYMFMA